MRSSFEIFVMLKNNNFKTMELIINQVYNIFNYPKPTSVTNVCTECCMSKEQARLLLTTALNEIPLEILQEYNDGAQALYFDRKEFSYFLPRYLELISQFQFTSAVDVSLSLKNLKFNCKELWTNKKEEKCIHDFIIAFFKNCLKTKVFPGNMQLIELINMLHISGFDANLLLTIWLEDLNGYSIVHLEQLITDNFNFRGKMYTNGIVDSVMSSILEDWTRGNKQFFLVAIEKHIMLSSLNEDHLYKLSYLYDTLRYI